MALVAAGACDSLSGQTTIPGPDSGPLGPVITPTDNPTTPDKVELGRLLFYDPVLSSDGEAACATCHSEEWGMSDGLPRSIGVGGGRLTGPGRVGDKVNRRNAQSLWNVGYRATLFWDGRETSLEAQVLSPLHSAIELDKRPDAVVAELQTLVEYVVLFEAAFPDDPTPVSIDSLSRAIAAFERTLIADRSLFDAWIDGDDGAMTPEMVRGWQVFQDAECAGCHVPPLFESDTYWDRGVGDRADQGRFEVTGVESDRHGFRVPTLRNVRFSEPFFHDGSVTELIDAVRHELARAHEPQRFDEEDLRALTHFLSHGLLDISRNPLRPAEVPSGLPVPLDGFRIIRF